MPCQRDRTEATARPIDRLTRLLRRTPKWLLSGLVVVAAALAFFNPIGRGLTFSDVPNHQSAIWPWIATPTGALNTFPQSDQADSFHPWQVFIGETLRDGELPLWNPHSFAGVPFLTNGQNGALYPPRAVLSLVTSAAWVHDLLSLINVTLAGLAMLAFLRVLRLGWLPSLFGALAWEFNSYTMGWLQLESVGPLVACLPAALACAHRAHERRSIGWASAAGAALAMGALGGTLSLVVVTYVVALGYLGAVTLASCIRERNWRLSAFGAIRVAVACLVGLLLPAIVLLPTFLEAHAGGRAPIPFDALRQAFAIPWRSLLRDWFLPPLLPAGEATLNNQLAFAGTAVAAFSVFGFFCRRQGVVLGRCLVVVGALLVAGSPATQALYGVIPGLSFVKPLGRLFFVFVFGVTILAALALDTTMTAITDRLKRRWPTRGTAFALAGAPTVVALAAIVLIVINTSQLLTFARGVNPPFQPRSSRYLYPTTPAIAALSRTMAADPAEAPGRLLPLESVDREGTKSAHVFYASQHMVFGLDSAAGYESLIPQRTVALSRFLAGEPASRAATERLQVGYIGSYSSSTTRLALLPRLGITAIITPPSITADPYFQSQRQREIGAELQYSGKDGSVYSIRGVQPRAWFVTRAVHARSATEALKRFTVPAFPFREAVVLESPIDIDTNRPRGKPPSSVELTSLGPNSYKVAVKSQTPGWLVLANSFDRGWRARANGKRAPLLRANFAFSAVRLQSGETQVSLSYTPPGFELGRLLTTATSLLLFLSSTLWIAARRFSLVGRVLR